MTFEFFIQALIFLHVVGGGIALLSGAMVLLLRKGDARHKKIGKIFYSSMLASAVLSCIVSILPKHENVFLFCLGILTLYLLIMGRKSLRFREKNPDLKNAKLLALGLGVVGLIMIASPILRYGKPNVITAVFGLVCLYIGLSDLRLYRRPKALQERWLRLHLGKTTGAYIASVTAFFVVNNILLVPMWNWFTPGVLGTLFIIYWSQRVEKKGGV